MASNTAVSSSSLSRYRPIIYAVICITAAASAVSLYNTFQTPAAPQLTRRGAVHRRRRRSATPSPESVQNDGVPTAVVDVRSREASLVGLHTPPANSGGWRSLEDGLAEIQSMVHRATLDPASTELGAYESLSALCLLQIVDRLGIEGEVDFRHPHEIPGFDAFLEQRGYPPDLLDHLPLDQDEERNTIAETEFGIPAPVDPIARQSVDGDPLRQLLYHISADRARQEGFVHRGVGCNACNMYPVHGIRWHCLNCADYDLCSDCEALGQHDKTHLFVKIQIPAPYLGSPRHMQPVVYPGRPGLLPRALPQELRSRLFKETKYELDQLDALYDQFTCLANVHPWDEDPNGLGAAINVAAFNKAFLPSYISTPKDNFLYRRYFAFFDSNDDGLIGFEEFVIGLAIIGKKLGETKKMRAAFDGYDDNGDGFISRKDCLHMFRSHFAIKMRITRDNLMADEDEFNLLAVQSNLAGSQPLNAIFQDDHERGNRTIPAKESLVQNSSFAPWHTTSLDDNVVQENREDRGPLWDAAVQEHRFADDVRQQRWQQRQFYIDEENGTRPPPGYQSDDDWETEEEQDDEPKANGAPRSALRGTPEESRPISPRSRSSSKVRFLDDDETRSEASNSSHRPKNERWGGYEVPEDEKDLGSDILYQVTQQGFIELLNPLFKLKETRAVLVHKTRAERKKWAKEIEEFEEDQRRKRKEQDNRQKDPLVATATAVQHAQEKREEEGEEESDASSTHATHISSLQNQELSQAEVDQEVTNAIAQAMGDPVQDVDNLIEGIVDEIRDSSLDDLLNQSGYSVGETPQTAPSEEIRTLDGAIRVEHLTEEVDMTLPHHRPSTPQLKDNGPSAPSRKEEATAEDSTAERTTDAKPEPQEPPSLERLALLSEANEFEKEIKERGGPGRVNFDEFLAKVSEHRHRRPREEGNMMFLEEWIDVGQI